MYANQQLYKDVIVYTLEENTGCVGVKMVPSCPSDNDYIPISTDVC